MFIPKKLKQCRERNKLTQTELMFELDKQNLRISRQTLISWELGRTFPNAKEISILANYFNKPIQYFFKQSLHKEC